jgi:hypothetical protein
MGQTLGRQQQSKRFQFSLIFLILLVMSFGVSFVTVSKAANSEEVSNNKVFACDNNQNNVGHIFYDFDALLVKFSGYPHPGHQKGKDFPEALKYENFRKSLVQSIRKSYSACLKTTFGSKPVIVLPRLPLSPETKLPAEALPDGSFQLTEKYSNADMHNPKNLTIVISVSYPIQTDDQIYGTASYFIYRPEIPYLDGRIPQFFNSGTTVFFPSKGPQQLKESLEAFFLRLRPLPTGFVSKEAQKYQ